MNGPFTISGWNATYVLDDGGNRVAEGYGEDDEAERKNAEMVCAALNAAYYIAQATGSQK